MTIRDGLQSQTSWKAARSKHGAKTRTNDADGWWQNLVPASWEKAAWPFISARCQCECPSGSFMPCDEV